VIPHFSYPFRLEGNSFAVVDQDTPDDIVQSVEILVATRRGQRQELPDYGIADPLFEDGLDLQDITDAIADWEPRATTAVDSEIDDIDQYINHIRVNVSGGDV
jgi:phage baseplate assembly protein W